MQFQDERIGKVSDEIAEKVIARVNPETLQRYDMERIARNTLPRSLDEVYLGPEDDALEMASCIVQAIRDAIRTRGEEIIRAPALDDVLSIVVSEVKDQATRLRGTGDAQAIAQGLSAVIEEHPSQLDAIAAAVVPPFKTKEAEASNTLRKTVVRVINKSEGFMGSGFAIGSKGYVLTAHHVIGNGRQLEVVFDGTTNWRGSARVVASLPEQDLSILELQSNSGATRAGLVPCCLGCVPAAQLEGHPVLGLGYHAEAYANGNGILDPCPTLARVVQQLPIRRVSFSGVEQPCLITVVEGGQEPIRKGMSGGPFLDLESNEAIALITGAQATGVWQFNKKYESLPVIEYGFGVLFFSIKESWPKFVEYCK